MVLLRGTPLVRPGSKDRWLVYSEFLRHGHTAPMNTKLSKINKIPTHCGRYRVLVPLLMDQTKDLDGIGEADETFLRESTKGSRNLPGPERRKQTRIAQRGTSEVWIHILAIRDRSGAAVELTLRI